MNDIRENLEGEGEGDQCLEKIFFQFQSLCRLFISMQLQILSHELHQQWWKFPHRLADLNHSISQRLNEDFT